MLEKSITLAGHLFLVEISESDEKVFYDHTEVSSLKPGAGTHDFEVEENGEQVRYRLILTYKKTSARNDKPYASYEEIHGDRPKSGFQPFGRNERHKADLYDTGAMVAKLLSREISSFDVAIVRNGDAIYDNGVPIPKIIKDTKKGKVRGGGDESEEFGVCTNCNLKVEIPNSHYCPNCGETLKTGAIVNAFSWKRRSPDRPNMSLDKMNSLPPCVFCGGKLQQDVPIAWCPFCGSVAHRAELIQSVRNNITCPKCGETIDKESLSNYLSSG